MFGKKLPSPKPQKWYVVEQWPMLGERTSTVPYPSEDAALTASREFMAEYGHPAYVLSTAEKEQRTLRKAAEVLESQ